MTLKIILLTMHDNELGYEIFPNMVEESSFATVFQASQGTCLVGFTYILAWKPNQNFIMCIRGSVFFFFWQFLQFLCYSQSGNVSTGRFSQIWLQAKYESKFLKTSFYISGYLVEPCIDITWLKSSKNHMILTVLIFYI